MRRYPTPKSPMFSDNHQYSVELLHDEFGRLGPAALTFGGGRAIQADVGLVNTFPNLPPGTAIGTVHALAQDGKTFTLYGCQIHQFAIDANVIVLGMIEGDTLRRISIRFTDVSEWLLHWHGISGTMGKALEWSTPFESHTVNFDSGTQAFTLSTEYAGELRRSGEDHILHEHIEFVLECQSAGLEAIPARRMILDLGCLLSILLAHPVSIHTVKVEAAADQWVPLYFPAFEAIERKSTMPLSRQALLPPEDFSARWEIALQHFFRSPHREILWVRLAGMQRYDSFWEYRALGYVTLLDRYVSQHPSAPPPARKSPGRKKLSGIHSRIKDLLPDGSDKTAAAIVRLVSDALSHQPLPTFADKYRHAIAETDSDVIKTINLSDEDFAFIKDVRDNIAHGDELGIDNHKFASIGTVISRIMLLLTYWAYRDFGWSAKDFLALLNNPFCPLRRDADINEQHLAKVMGTAEFFELSAASWSAVAKAARALVPCFLEGPPGTIAFSEVLTERIRAAIINKQYDGDKLPTILGVPKEALRHVPHAYLSCAGQTQELHNLQLIARPETMCQEAPPMPASTPPDGDRPEILDTP